MDNDLRKLICIAGHCAGLPIQPMKSIDLSKKNVFDEIYIYVFSIASVVSNYVSVLWCCHSECRSDNWFID